MTSPRLARAIALHAAGQLSRQRLHQIRHSPDPTPPAAYDVAPGLTATAREIADAAGVHAAAIRKRLERGVTGPALLAPATPGGPGKRKRCGRCGGEGHNKKTCVEGLDSGDAAR